MSRTMYRDERLHIIEEEPYKKGGRVKKGKKKKTRKGTVRQTVIVNVGQPKPKKREKRRQAPKRQQMMPGAPSALTGMGSVVFGAPQTPSYFRAVGPEQKTFASLPGSLKALEEGQAKTLKKLQYFEDEGKKQYQRQQEFNREVMEEYEQRMRQQQEEKEERRPRASISVVSSRSSTPVISYSTAVVPPPIQTLRPLERQRTDTPPIMTPSASSLSSSSIPTTAVRVEPTWAVSTSSREAGYMGADETLPVQAPASGANMVPEDVVFESAPDSAFIPISASAPESVGDAVERAAQVATSSSSSAVEAPKKISLAKKIIGIKKPAPAPAPAPASPAPAPVPAPAPAPVARDYYMRDPDRIGGRDELNSMASGLGISNPKRAYVGPGSSDRLREAIKEAQRARR